MADKKKQREAEASRTIDVPATPSPETAIVPRASTVPALAVEVSAEEMERKAAQLISFYQKLVHLIAKNVPLSEITLFGGRKDSPPQVWFSANACRRILQWTSCDFLLQPVEDFHYEGPDGPAIMFRVYGELVTARGERRSILGTRSTADEFFSKRYRQHCPKCNESFSKGTYDCPKCKGKTERESFILPLKEIGLSDVIQAAISNAWNKALSAAGLMPSFEDLEAGLLAAGKDITKIARVGFGGGGESSAAEVEPENLSAMRTKVFTALARVCDNDRAKMADTLEKVTAFTAKDGKEVKGKREVEKLTAKQLPYVLEALEKMAKGKPAPTQPSSAAPKANVPDATIFGPVTKVAGPTPTKSSGTMMIVTMRPKSHGDAVDEVKLYCFDNKTMQGQNGEPIKAFEVLKGAAGKECTFAFKQEKKGDQAYSQITAIFRVGEHHWDDDGVPYVDRNADMREPGEDEDQERLF